MTPIRARSRSPLSSVTSMESNSCRAWSADRTGVLPRFTTYLGPRTAPAGHPGVTVPDVGGEELDEALAGARAGRRDRGRQHVDAGANERRRRRDHVVSGQNYGFLRLFRHGSAASSPYPFYLS